MLKEFNLTKQQETAIRALAEQAKFYDMVIDEDGSLIPKSCLKRNYWTEYNNDKDNDPASPEQAWA